MKRIHDKSEFQNLLNINKKIIVFCFHGWSGYSRVSKKIVEEWEKNSNREIWEFDATNMNYKNYFYEWIINKEKGNWSEEGVMKINRYSPRRRIHGYGEICWIISKEVVGFECVFDSFSPDQLKQRTLELF